jgi:hypothetical protein
MVMQEDVCANCGMPKEAWKGNRGEGYTDENGQNIAARLAPRVGSALVDHKNMSAVRRS